jgi:hypothetical protein
VRQSENKWNRFIPTCFALTGSCARRRDDQLGTAQWILALVAMRSSLRPFLFSCVARCRNGDGPRRRSSIGLAFVYRSTMRPVVHPPNTPVRIKARCFEARPASHRVLAPDGGVADPVDPRIASLKGSTARSSSGTIPLRAAARQSQRRAGCRTAEFHQARGPDEVGDGMRGRSDADTQ